MPPRPGSQFAPSYRGPPRPSAGQQNPTAGDRSKGARLPAAPATSYYGQGRSPTTPPTTAGGDQTQPLQPWDRNWGEQYFRPPQQPQQPAYDWSWMDISSPGAAEQRYEQTDWGAPNAASEYWEGLSGAFASGPSKTDFLGEYASAFQPNQLSYSEQMVDRGAGLDPYYDRAGKEGAEKLASRFAAMGLTGSSGTGDAMSDLYSDLYADKAFREADFDLRAAGQGDASRFARSGEARAWGGERDAANRANEDLELNYLLGGGRLAGQAAGEGRADRESGMRAAISAQAAREGRIGDYADRTFRQGESDRNFYASRMDSLFDADKGNLDAELEALLGPQAASYNLSRQQKSDFMELVSTGVDVAEALRQIQRS